MNDINPPVKSLTILMAEDDPDDRFLIQRAFEMSGLIGRIVFVEDGEELLDYLFRRGRYVTPASSPRPSCLLLDLNMPRKDGRETLWEIKHDPAFKDLPVVVLTTSSLPQDKVYCAELSVCDFVTKPNTFDELIGLIKKTVRFCA